MSQTIFITGSSTGLGRATAVLFARHGWRVLASMRDPAGETELGKAEFELTGYEPGRRPLIPPKQLAGIVEKLAP